MPETIAIIGAGPLGRWLALSAARAGYRVLLEDVMPTHLRHAQEFLRQQLSAGQLGIEFVTTIEDAVRQADLAIDCMPDELESKLEILWLLDRMAPPRCVLATPTTRLSIADLANCTYRPEKVIAIAAEASALAAGDKKGVLLRTSSRTSPETVELLRGFWIRLGFMPAVAPDPAEKYREQGAGNREQVRGERD